MRSLDPSQERPEAAGGSQNRAPSGPASSEASTKESPALTSSAVWLTPAIGLAAGLIGWLLIEATHGWFAPDLEALGGLDKTEELGRAQDRAAVWNSALAHGLLGAILGMAMGISGRLGRGLDPRPARSRRWWAVPAGLMLGAAVGAMAGAGVPEVVRSRGVVSDDLLLALAIHVAIWSATGAAVGLALALGRGSGHAPALVGGLVGGAIAAVLYEVIGALAFSNAATYRPVAMTWPPRLLACLLLGGLAALGAASGRRRRTDF